MVSSFNYNPETFLEGGADFFSMRMEMGKSTSAPPPGLINSVRALFYVDLTFFQADSSISRSYERRTH